MRERWWLGLVSYHVVVRIVKTKNIEERRFHTKIDLREKAGRKKNPSEIQESLGVLSFLKTVFISVFRPGIHKKI